MAQLGLNGAECAAHRSDRTRQLDIEGRGTHRPAAAEHRQIDFFLQYLANGRYPRTIAVFPSKRGTGVFDNVPERGDITATFLAPAWPPPASASSASRGTSSSLR